MSLVRKASSGMFLIALAVATQAAHASGGDVGYDDVTKLLVSQGDAPPAPGTFTQDFSVASTPAKASTGHMPFGLGKMMASVQNAGAMLKNGTAHHHYVGATKFRDDDLTAGTGDLTDCTARTLTHIDFNAKTYHVSSLDQPQAAPSHSSGSQTPGPAPTDDGTRVALAITSHALGPMTIDGVATSGYDMNIKMTVTKPGTSPSTSNEELTSYYTNMPEPHETCAGMRTYAHAASSGANNPAAAQMAMAMSAMMSKGDSRFKVSVSGPPLPSGKLSLWDLFRLKGADESAGGFGVLTERGNVHQLSDSDPAFGVPAGFTQV